MDISLFFLLPRSGKLGKYARNPHIEKKNEARSDFVYFGIIFCVLFYSIDNV